MPCLDMARNRFVNKPVIVVRDICKPHTHRMGHAVVTNKGTGPNPLCGRYQELAFSRAEEEAKVIEKLGHFRAEDESSNEAEVFGSSDHKAIRSYYSYRPCDFDSRVLTFFHSHGGARVFRMI